MLENADRKLKEMYQFLEQMKSSNNVDDFERYFAAFISAGRSVTFSLQLDLRNIDGFSEWYSVKQQEMKEDELLKFFKDLRNSDIHTGKPNTSSSIFIKGPVDSKKWENRPRGSSIKVTGRGVYYVKNPDTPFEEVIPAQFPNKTIHKIGFKNPPTRHNGKIINQNPVSLCKLYIDYLNELVKEAKIFFWNEGTTKLDKH
jgi:hypothetical protein